MLFQKSMEPRCIYCAKGSYLEKDTVLCPKKGVVSAAFFSRYRPFSSVIRA